MVWGDRCGVALHRAGQADAAYHSALISHARASDTLHQPKPEELCAPPRTSPIATTPPLERIRQGPGIADGWSPRWKSRSRPGRSLIHSANSILNSNQFQIVRRNDFPFRILHFQSRRFSGAFIQNLKTFLAAGEEITFSPLAQSNDDRKQLLAFWG